MSNNQNLRQQEVTAFLDAQNHPLRAGIEFLRQIILGSEVGLEENIKWNGPNYTINGEDRITMKIQPPKSIQIVFHRGAKVREQPGERLIHDPSRLLTWRENDRAIATFRNIEEIENQKPNLAKAVKDWIAATR